MEKNLNITVVGGGVIGTSIAWFLSYLKADITLIEQGQIGGGGATHISKGILRLYDPQIELAKIAKVGVNFYLNWPAHQLYASPTTHKGMMYRLSPKNLKYAQNFVSQFTSDQYPIYLYPYEKIKLENQQLNWNDQDWVIYEPLGGYGDPIKTAKYFSLGAKENGITILENKLIQKIERIKNNKWKLVTSKKEIYTDIIVLAAGAYSKDLFDFLPLTTKTIGIPKFELTKGALEKSIIDEISETYLRPLQKNAFVAGSKVSENSHWTCLNKEATYEQREDAKNRVKKILIPNCNLIEQDNTLGFDGFTSDFRPILNMGEKAGLYIATGFSGRGYKMAPAIGSLVSKKISEDYKLNPSTFFRGSFKKNLSYKYKIGIVGDLSYSGSVHTRTLQRALRYIEEIIIPKFEFPVELIVVNDEACVDGAIKAANQLIDKGVQSIVGHFSSEAASAALPIYKKSDKPLLLPAATLDSLTQDYSNAFRVCPSNSLQIEIMVNFLSQYKGGKLRIIDDGGMQAKEMKAKIERRLVNENIKTVNHGEDFSVYIGRFHIAKHLIEKNEIRSDVLFSDDVYHSKLFELASIFSKEIFVCGFSDYENFYQTKEAREWYFKSYNQKPGCYFFETIASVQFAISALCSVKFENSPIKGFYKHSANTVLGKLRFEKNENTKSKYFIWKALGNSFIKQEVNFKIKEVA